MAELNDIIRSAFPDGNVPKQLTDIVGALLGSDVLTGGGAGQTAQPTTDTSEVGGLLGGLGGLLNKLQQGGLSNETKSWSVPDKISPSHLASLVLRLAPASSKCWLRSQASPRRSSLNNYRRFCPGSLTS